MSHHAASVSWVLNRWFHFNRIIAIFLVHAVGRYYICVVCGLVGVIQIWISRIPSYDNTAHIYLQCTKQISLMLLRYNKTFSPMILSLDPPKKVNFEFCSKSQCIHIACHVCTHNISVVLCVDIYGDVKIFYKKKWFECLWRNKLTLQCLVSGRRDVIKVAVNPLSF